MAYPGSFAKGFIDAFLEAQNQQAKRRYYQMLQQRLEFQMRQSGYSPDANSGRGGWYSWAKNDFSATSPQQMERERMAYNIGLQKDGGGTRTGRDVRGGGADGDGGKVTGKFWTADNQQHAYDVLMQSGKFSPYGAAGAVARMTKEAPDGPTSVNQKSGAFGIAQWLGDRKTPIAGNTNFDDQLKYYAGADLDAPEQARAKAQFKNASTPEEGSYAAMHFERAGGYKESGGRSDVLLNQTPTADVYDTVHGGTTTKTAVPSPGSTRRVTAGAAGGPDVTIGGKVYHTDADGNIIDPDTGKPTAPAPAATTGEADEPFKPYQVAGPWEPPPSSAISPEARLLTPLLRGPTGDPAAAGARTNVSPVPLPGTQHLAPSPTTAGLPRAQGPMRPPWSEESQPALPPPPPQQGPDQRTGAPPNVGITPSSAPNRPVMGPDQRTGAPPNVGMTPSSVPAPVPNVNMVRPGPPTPGVTPAVGSPAPATPPPRPSTPVTSAPAIPPRFSDFGYIRDTQGNLVPVQSTPDVDAAQIANRGYYVPATGNARAATYINPNDPLWHSYNTPTALQAPFTGPGQAAPSSSTLPQGAVDSSTGSLLPSQQSQPSSGGVLQPQSSPAASYYTTVNDAPNYGGIASAPDMGDVSAGEDYSGEDLGFQRGGAIPYGSYRFTRYQDGGDVDYSSAPTDTTPVVSSDASVQGDDSQTQQGASLLGSTEGSMGKSFSSGYGSSKDRALQKKLYGQSKGGSGSTQFPSLYDIPGNLVSNLKTNFQNSSVGRFIQNPGQTLSAIPGQAQSTFMSSPVGQLMANPAPPPSSSAPVGYRRGGRVTKFDDGGSTGEGVTGSVSTGDDSATNTTNVGGVSAVTGTTDTGFGVADMGHAGPNAGGGAGAEGGGSGTSATSAAPGLAAVVNSMTNAIFGSPASAQTISPSVKDSLNEALSQLAQARGTTVSQLLGPSGGDTGLSPAAIAALRASNYSGNFMGKAGASGPGMGVDIGGGTTVVSQSPPDAPKSTSQLAPGNPAQVAPPGLSSIQAAYLSGLASPGFANPPPGFNNMGFPSAGLASIGTGFGSSGSAPPGSSIGTATITGGLGGPGGVASVGPGGVASAPRGVPSPNAPSPNASPMMGQGPPAPAPGAPGQPIGLANVGIGGSGLAGGAEAVSQAPATGGAFHGAPMPNVGRVAKGGPIGSRSPGSRANYRTGRYAAGGPVTFFANSGPAIPSPGSSASVDPQSNMGGSNVGGNIARPLLPFHPGKFVVHTPADMLMATINEQGPSRTGLPLGTPQITDDYGNPSFGATQGISAGSRNIVKNHALQIGGAVPTQQQSVQRQGFYGSENAMDPRHVKMIGNTVDPEGILSTQKRHLAALESIHRFGLMSGHVEDAASANGAYLLHLQDEAKQYGLAAVAALNKGDIQSAVYYIKQGYELIPDGMQIHTKINPDGTVQVRQMKLDGTTVFIGDVGPQQLLMAAHGLGTGIGFWKMLSQGLGKYEPRKPVQRGFAQSPPPAAVRRYQAGGVVRYANGGGVGDFDPTRYDFTGGTAGQQPVIQPNPVDYSASSMGSGAQSSSSTSPEDEDLQDQREIASLDLGAGDQLGGAPSQDQGQQVASADDQPAPDAQPAVPSPGEGVGIAPSSVPTQVAGDAASGITDIDRANQVIDQQVYNFRQQREAERFDQGDPLMPGTTNQFVTMPNRPVITGDPNFDRQMNTRYSQQLKMRQDLINQYKGEINGATAAKSADLRSQFHENHEQRMADQYAGTQKFVAGQANLREQEREEAAAKVQEHSDTAAAARVKAEQDAATERAKTAQTAAEAAETRRAQAPRNDKEVAQTFNFAPDDNNQLSGKAPEDYLINNYYNKPADKSGEDAAKAASVQAFTKDFPTVPQQRMVSDALVNGFSHTHGVTPSTTADIVTGIGSGRYTNFSFKAMDDPAYGRRFAVTVNRPTGGRATIVLPENDLQNLTDMAKVKLHPPASTAPPQVQYPAPIVRPGRGPAPPAYTPPVAPPDWGFTRPQVAPRPPIVHPQPAPLTTTPYVRTLPPQGTAIPPQ